MGRRARRNAERLLNADTDAQRASIVNSIQANAAAWARGIALVQIPGYRQSRDAYCERQLSAGQ